MKRTLILPCLALILAAPATGSPTAELADALLDRRAVIGVMVADLDPALAAQLDLDPGAGILITEVTEGMPADAAGMKRYDVITRIGGRPVRSRDSLTQALAGLGEGASVELTVVRCGRPLQLTVGVAVTDSQADSSQLQRLRELGYVLAEQGDTVAAEQVFLEAVASEDARRALEFQLARQSAQDQLATQAHQTDQQRREMAELMKREQVMRQRSEGLTDQAQAQLAQLEHERAAMMELQNQVSVLQDTLANNLDRLDSARARLRNDADVITTRLRDQLALLLRAQPDLSTNSQAVMEKDMDAVVRSARDALLTAADQLEMPRVRMVQNPGGRPHALVDEARKRVEEIEQAVQNARPTRSEDRLREMEERMRRMEQMIQELVDRQDGGGR